MLLNTSAIRWLDFCQYLATYNSTNSPNGIKIVQSITKCYKNSQKNAQEFFNFFQSGKISPNLVTLLNTISVQLGTNLF